MSKLSAIFDFDDIRNNLSKLENKDYELKDNKGFVAKSAKILERQIKKPKVILSNEITKEQAIKLIDIQMSILKGRAPMSYKVWEYIRDIVDSHWES